jgi:hypothetical protein
MTNDEVRNPKEARNPNEEIACRKSRNRQSISEAPRFSDVFSDFVI